MKTSFLFTAFLFIATLLSAQKPIGIKLWENGAPNQNGTNDAAILYVFPAKEANGLSIVACPGGAYAMLAMNHEGLDMADWFNAQGITYAVLKYRMPHGHHDVPLSDVQEAIRIMHKNAAQWNIKKVGIMGSSAGGHLASTAATHFTHDTRPDFQILFYPVITMDPTYTHMGSHDNLLGKPASKELETLYSNEKQVTAQTPPAFIMHSSDDTVVPVRNSIDYYTALTNKQVSATMHIYPTGNHGWGYQDRFIYKRQWTGELEKWLRELNK